MKVSLWLLIFSTGILLVSKIWGATQAQLNILFLAVDDLRPEIAAYSQTASEQSNGPSSRLPVISPAMDRLANEGTVFERAYCQQAVCGPSRLSLMTGTYPDRFGIYGMGKRMEWRDSNPDLSTIPQVFKENGWEAVGFGKIFDNRLGLDEEKSWDAFTQGWKLHYQLVDNAAIERAWRKSWSEGRRPEQALPATEAAEVADNAYTDGHITDLALDYLKNRDDERPFFLAVGYPKPHLPFVAPTKYWELYDPEQIEEVLDGRRIVGSNRFTFSDYKEILDYDVPDPMDESTARLLVHGYLACVSYVDAQIERLVDGLKELGEYENTIVVLWGDHGFKLGEYDQWGKATNLEVDVRSPLIIRVPESQRDWKPVSHTPAIVELIDVFPTLCELAGLEVPETVQGSSLLPLISGEEEGEARTALSQYPRRGVMGYSLRTDRWRYTEWKRPDGAIIEQELYDFSAVPAERVNIAKEQARVVEELSERLDEKLIGVTE